MKTSFPLSATKVSLFAVLLDQGPLDNTPADLGQYGDITIPHRYQYVAVFIDEDAANEWVSYQKESHLLTVCPAEGFKTDVDLTPLFDTPFNKDE